MGLDQHLHKRRRGGYVEEVMVLRKNYVVDDWFSKYVGEDIENCKTYSGISINDLCDLLMYLTDIVKSKTIDIESRWGYHKISYENEEYKITYAIKELAEVIYDHEKGNTYEYFIWY